MQASTEINQRNQKRKTHKPNQAETVLVGYCTTPSNPALPYRSWTHPTQRKGAAALAAGPGGGLRCRHPCRRLPPGNLAAPQGAQRSAQHQLRGTLPTDRIYILCIVFLQNQLWKKLTDSKDFYHRCIYLTALKWSFEFLIFVWLFGCFLREKSSAVRALFSCSVYIHYVPPCDIRMNFSESKYNLYHNTTWNSACSSHPTNALHYVSPDIYVCITRNICKCLGINMKSFSSPEPICNILMVILTHRYIKMGIYIF